MMEMKLAREESWKIEEKGWMEGGWDGVDGRDEESDLLGFPFSYCNCIFKAYQYNHQAKCSQYQLLPFHVLPGLFWCELSLSLSANSRRDPTFETIELKHR